ncbi:HET-domain-containing protein [Bimuria novae-zelandiae CBS 107.79]|uniref:HET-domain-containing protein n=1 Tax=Bimuria novae-zelandiae CBS 107.79 TaxID=1447943 RepID=A0A6A5UWS2_9PLEO|nr:HET-domain-containing protein [Bimuria novae-zelandiae CBS 107.79]
MAFEHSERCSFLTREEECDCYLSENARFLGPKQAPFSPATRTAPPGPLGQVNEEGRNQIRDFLAKQLDKSKPSAHDAPLSTNSVYSALNPGEIRVLELNPGQFAESLHGALHVARIDFQYPRISSFQRYTNHAISLPEGEPLWYTALSYTWGEPIFDVEFHFANEASIQITSSLASALKHLRSEHDSVFLWIDQICIDQSNVKEKEKQIPLMGMIYAHATNTVIWLGDEDVDDPQVAFDMIQRVHSQLQLYEGTIQLDDFERLKFPALYVVAVPPEWVQVLALFRRPWFSRLWVIQEAVLSMNLYVKCGRAVVPWDDFAVWCETMRASGIGGLLERAAPTRETRFGLLTVNELSTFRTFDQTHESQPSLLETLVMSRYARASNAKDKEVFQEAAVAVLPTNLFGLLSCVDSEVPTSPSWVPDWTSDNPTEPLGFSTKTWALYSAGGLLSGSKESDEFEHGYILQDDGRSLVLRGVLFDTVESFSTTMNNPFIEVHDGSQLPGHTWPEPGITVSANDELKESLTMIQQNTLYPAGETIWDAFWKTLVAGKDATSLSKAPDKYSEVLSLIVDELSGRELRIPGQPYSPRRQKGYFTTKSLMSRKPRKTLNDLDKAFRTASDRRRFAITRKRYFCLVPRGTKKDDYIVVFQGGHVPFVVREKSGVGDKGGFELVGETYVHGLMKGEIFDKGSVAFENIKLV